MLLEEIKNIKSSKSDLRKFGITFGIVFAVLGGALWWKGKDSFTLFILVSSAFFIIGLLVPFLLKPLQKVWMTLAVVLGWFMTRLILSILFYCIFTLIGLISRLLGKRFLDLEMDNTNESYWIQREQKVFDKKDYERQF
jgi:hypothetical protein